VGSIRLADFFVGEQQVHGIPRTPLRAVDEADHVHHRRPHEPHALQRRGCPQRPVTNGLRGLDHSLPGEIVKSMAIMHFLECRRHDCRRVAAAGDEVVNPPSYLPAATA
jgi:hypothetical protein